MNNMINFWVLGHRHLSAYILQIHIRQSEPLPLLHNRPKVIRVILNYATDTLEGKTALAREYWQVAARGSICRACRAARPGHQSHCEAPQVQK